LIVDILSYEGLFRNDNPSITLFACQLPLHKGAFGAAKTCSPHFGLGQAEHPAVHWMQESGQIAQTHNKKPEGQTTFR